MGGILTFREGTAEIKENAINAVGLNVLRQILRTAFYKPHILNSGFLYFLTGGDYNITNPTGKYIGKYQLDRSYLNGDHSPANQEIVVQKYVNERYNGSFVQAKAHWQAKGWY